MAENPDADKAKKKDRKREKSREDSRHRDDRSERSDRSSTSKMTTRQKPKASTSTPYTKPTGQKKAATPSKPPPSPDPTLLLAGLLKRGSPQPSKLESVVSSTPRSPQEADESEDEDDGRPGMSVGGDDNAVLDEGQQGPGPGPPGPPDDDPDHPGGAGGGGPNGPPAPGPPGGPPGGPGGPGVPEGPAPAPGRLRGRGLMDHREILAGLAPEHPMTRGFLCGLFDDVGPALALTAAGGRRPLNRQERCVVLLMHTVIKASHAGVRGEDNIKIGLVGELMAPYLPVDRLSRSPAERLRESAHNMLTNTNYLLREGTGFGGHDLPYPPQPVFTTLEDALMCYYGLRESIRPTYANYLRDVQIEFMYAVCVRGNTTEAKVSRFIRNYAEQTGTEPSLSRDRVRLYYQYYGKFLTATNIRPLLTAWGRELPEPALSMRLIVSQAAYGGMTQLVTIGQSMITFPDFPWFRLMSVFPGEFEAFTSALGTVNGNAYYGYTRDMGSVAARNYMNLSYAAKELLIRSGGFDSLRNYGGWPRSCKEQMGVDTLINTYLARRASGLTAETVEAPLEYRDTIAAVARYQDMFKATGFGLDQM